MNVEELLEMMEETLEAGTIVPFSASKRMVDVDRMRDIIDEVRNNLPDEIRESKKIVNDREQIMQNARIESESIIQQAEERARVLTSEQEIVKRSQQHAAEILSAAQKSAKELTRKATLYCETILKNSEEVLGRSMADIKNTRMNLRSAARPKNNMPKYKMQRCCYSQHISVHGNTICKKTTPHRAIWCGAFLCPGAGILPRAHLLQTADLHPDPFVQTVKNQFMAQFFPACPCFLLNKMVLLFYHRWVIVV